MEDDMRSFWGTLAAGACVLLLGTAVVSWFVVRANVQAQRFQALAQEERARAEVNEQRARAAVAEHLARVAAKEAKGEKAVATRVFEMRTYYAGPGKMKALHARFRDHTCKLFEKHGMTLIGFWSPTDPQDAEEKMVYILAFPSREAADKSWKAFVDDPVWKAAKDASEKDGKLVEKVERVFLNPTDYSPIK
jgi:hypothetical protein